MMPDDIDTELRDTIGQAVDAHTTTVVDDPLGAIEQRVTQRRHRRHLVIGGSIAAVLVAAVAVAGAVAISDSDNEPRVVVSPTTTVPAPLFTQAVEAMPTPPLAVRGDAAVVWNGAELVVWGGRVDVVNMGLEGEDRSYNDGASYNPLTRTWRKLGASPLPATADTPIGAPTAGGVVIASESKVAAWDSDTNSWRSFDDAPSPVHDLAVDGNLALSYSANATLDLTTGIWTGLPAPPIQLDRSGSAWTGRELIVIGGPTTPFKSAVGVALDLQTRQWRRIADLPSDMYAEALALDWDGTRIVAANYDMEAATYDPATDRWTKLASVPARFSEWYPAVRSTGGYTAAFMPQAVVVLSADDTWVPLPSANLPWGTIATTQPSFGTQADDGVLFVWGIDGDQNTLHAMDVDRLVERPPEIQVGFFTVTLEDGWSIRSTQYDESSEFAQTVRVTIGDGTNECRLASGAPTLPLESLAVEDPLGEMNWRRNELGTQWQAEFSTTDTFTADCDTSEAALAITKGVSPPASR